jgi:mono/diheme cytochrome c family protein
MKSTMLRAGVLVAILAMFAVAVVAPRINAQSAATPAADQTAVAPEFLAEGEAIVSAVCLSCHQPGGAGIEGEFPALAANPFVTLEDPTVVISTVLRGRGGMPTFAGSYSDEQIAAILTYIRTSWGNDASPVTPEQVAAVRAEVMTAPESTEPEAEPTIPADGIQITY